MTLIWKALLYFLVYEGGYTMDLTNRMVQHKVFGKGKICELKENDVYVSFAKEIKKIHIS